MAKQIDAQGKNCHKERNCGQSFTAVCISSKRRVDIGDELSCVLRFGHIYIYISIRCIQIYFVMYIHAGFNIILICIVGLLISVYVEFFLVDGISFE